MGNKALIIGAGGSGRGFIARLLSMDGCHVDFMDCREELISELNARGSYTIHVGEHRTPYVVSGYRAAHAEDPWALELAAQADYIFVCVGLQNNRALAPFFLELAKTKPQAKIIVCENGLEPRRELRDALAGTPAAGMQITQGVIFCTSIEEKKGELSILSQQYDSLPYDVGEALFELPFEHFTPVNDFACLMRQKIFTYNCISACIAYLGYLKGYTDYGEAARDGDVFAMCQKLRESLDQVVALELGIDRAAQTAFSQGAVDKFTSRAISDTILKNARSVTRKISPDERLMGPLALYLRFGLAPNVLCLIIAAALIYLEREESLSWNGQTYGSPAAVFEAVNPEATQAVKDAVSAAYARLCSGLEWNDVLAQMQL